MKKFKILLVVFFLSDIAYSQTIMTDDSKKIISTSTMEKKIGKNVIQSSSNSGFMSFKNFTQLKATNDGTSAEASLSYLNQSSANYTLNISTPISKKGQQVKPLTISGLTNNSTVNIGAQKIFWGNGLTHDINLYNKAVEEWKQKKRKEANYAYLSDSDKKDLERTLNDFSEDDFTAAEKSHFEKAAGIKWGITYFIGGKLGFEQQDFNYLIDSAKSFQTNELSKTALTATFSLGIINKQGGTYAVTYAFKMGYQASNSMTFSIPTSSGAFVQEDLNPTPPSEQISNKVRLEYLSGGKSGSIFRINPNLNFEFNQKLMSFEFPLYFLTSDDKKTNFNGGIYAGYVSDKDFTFNFNKQNIGFGVFIGANINELFK